MKCCAHIKAAYPNKFHFVGHYYRLKHQEERIILAHYAFRVWDRSHHGSWNLYGHSHGTLPDDPHARAIDVGIDCHNYYPIEFDQVKEIMDKKLWQPIDHHGTHQEAGGVGLSKEEYAKADRKRQFEQLTKEFEKQRKIKYNTRDWVTCTNCGHKYNNLFVGQCPLCSNAYTVEKGFSNCKEEEYFDCGMDY
jgi:hypothetical protein